MKKFIATLLVTIINFSSVYAKGDLEGTLLGVARYENTGKISSKVRPRKNHRAVRLYLNEVKNEPGSYYAILLEYHDLFKIGPKYIASNKLPKLSQKIGFLNQIIKRTSLYKVTPTDETGVFEMQNLRVVSDRLEADNSENPSFLILSENQTRGSYALEGAKITASRDGEPTEVYFPYLNKDDNKDKSGVQYHMAKFVYAKAKLDSTWEKEYTPGAYLGAYADKNDVILNLRASGDKKIADFNINLERSQLPQDVREKQLTNPKSAYIKGEYEIVEVAEGMFIFKSTKQNRQAGEEIVEGRIGLFIDIFDASKSLQQYVVELILVNPDNHEDFLMYYEHPDNRVDQ